MLLRLTTVIVKSWMKKVPYIPSMKTKDSLIQIVKKLIMLSQVRNKIIDFWVDYDDDYLIEKNEQPPLPEGVGTSGCVNMSNVLISDDSMREMTRSLNSQQRQIFDEVCNW